MTAQTHDTTTTASTAARPARRADAGTVRLSQRDIHGLLLADVYYQCPHRPDNPRHTADHPAHPRTVKAPERRLDRSLGCSSPSTSSAPGLDSATKARLYAAFDLQIMWNKPGKQATVYAEITEATLRALPSLLDPDRDGYDDTADTTSGEVAYLEDLFEYSMRSRSLRSPSETLPTVRLKSMWLVTPCSSSALLISNMYLMLIRECDILGNRTS